MAPTEKRGQTQVAAEASASVALDEPDIITGEHGGDMFTDGVLIGYKREVRNAGHDTAESDSGWFVMARVFGARVGRRRNPDGTPKRLSSHSQQTFIQGQDVFPDWLSVISDKYHPEQTAT